MCVQVSLRKQEITDRLNAWIIFNEKNKELCEWLTQMENKMAHSAELSIEEMVEKLKKVNRRSGLKHIHTTVLKTHTRRLEGVMKPKCNKQDQNNSSSDEEHMAYY